MAPWPTGRRFVESTELLKLFLKFQLNLLNRFTVFYFPPRGKKEPFSPRWASPKVLKKWWWWRQGANARENVKINSSFASVRQNKSSWKHFFFRFSSCFILKTLFSLARWAENKKIYYFEQFYQESNACRRPGKPLLCVFPSLKCVDYAVILLSAAQPPPLSSYRPSLRTPRCHRRRIKFPFHPVTLLYS